jgi:hypothetical protein
MFGVLHHRDAADGRNDLLEHLQPLARHGVLENGKSGDVAARMCEACDKAVTHRIGHQYENDGNDARSLLRGRQRGRASCHNHVWIAGDQFGRFGADLLEIDDAPVIFD